MRSSRFARVICLFVVRSREMPSSVAVMAEKGEGEELEPLQRGSSLEWRGLCLTLTRKESRLEILADISGGAYPGQARVSLSLSFSSASLTLSRPLSSLSRPQLLSIMGSTGSGKSSLCVRDGLEASPRLTRIYHTASTSSRAG